jgi:hypothetical protein
MAGRCLLLFLTDCILPLLLLPFACTSPLEWQLPQGLCLKNLLLLLQLQTLAPGRNYFWCWLAAGCCGGGGSDGGALAASALLLGRLLLLILCISLLPCCYCCLLILLESN